ncbi:Mitochondrial-processing peptidase subunit beta [Balamuthia mandrillaris]
MLTSVRSSSTSLNRALPAVFQTQRFYAAKVLTAEQYSERPTQSIGEFQSSSLPNGLSLATVNTEVPLSAVGVFVKAGSRHESSEFRGASHFLKHFAFQRTSTRSPLRVCREFELTAGDYTCGVTREHIVYSSQFQRQKLGEVVPMLSDVLSPLIREWVVRDLKPVVIEETLEAERDPDTQLVEALHTTAFRHTGLGNSLFCPTYRTSAITPDLLNAYHNSRFQPHNITLVGVGVDHEEFVELASKHFGGAATSQGGKPQKEASKYAGGEALLPDPNNTRLAIAFEGLSNTDKDRFALLTLSSLLGGSERYSKDGPGRGLRSRLYTNLVAKNEFVTAASTFNAAYSDAGLWGVYAEAQPQHGAALAEQLTAELANVRKQSASGIAAEELTRAKNHAKSVLLRGLESESAQASLLPFVALQRSVSEQLLTPAQLCEHVDKVTAEDVSRVAQRLLKGNPTVVVTGDVVGAPLGASIKSAIGL